MSYGISTTNNMSVYDSIRSTHVKKTDGRMNVHPDQGPESTTAITSSILTPDNGTFGKLHRSLSTNEKRSSNPWKHKSPSSQTKSKVSLPSKKSSSNINSKSGNSLPKNITIETQPPRISSLKFIPRTDSLSLKLNSTVQSLENKGGSRAHHTPYLGRSPSTPTLRNFPTSISDWEDEDFPVILDGAPQLPPILPIITFSSDIIAESSVISVHSSSPTPSTNSTSGTSSASPSSSSISSADTTNENEDETPLDITTFLAAPRLTQRVRLKSGRVVSFSEVGDRNGFPVFVFLGMGCVRYFIAFFDDLASSYGLRLICPDRPGVGLSDNVKVQEQQVLKWPEVIEELCDIMSIKKFFIMAHSAGAPYALACALKMPERLQGTIYLVCPWVSTAIANNFRWLRFVPTPIMKITNTAGISLQQMLYGRQPYTTRPSHRNSGALASPLSSLEKKQQLGLAILKASFAENLAGANNDLLMCFERRHSFGYSYTDVNHPVHIFHGTKDERIPVSAVKWMEEEMPQCKLTLIEGGKHSLLLRAEVVDTIFKSIAVQLHVKDECRVCKLSSKCWLMEESENCKKKDLVIVHEVVVKGEKPKRTTRRRSLPVKIKPPKISK
ncbi:hypothetical protein G9A89_004422 [Geosiphon pyriformis]|nr:hypothetical protein G9A89_004422 [Geosiphon pyriformis]